MKRLALVLMLGLVALGCKSGPWFLRPKIYKTYAMPIYQDNSTTRLRTDGYYLQQGELHPNHSFRAYLIFTDKGYVISGNIIDDNIEQRIKEEFADRETYKTSHDWYRVEKDSLFIEFFGNAATDMVSSVFYKTGKIKSAEELEIRFDDAHDLLYNYKFVKSDKLPNVKNTASYLDKKWYNEKLHLERK
ncbi:hypothetical protein [Flavobacterium sp.]|uniref:hypothetical protein n=1 Tax=Flavobacterium sp. TaxID=239 RepID=UPI00121577D9|nr:hypothetical protein [Flavobacterium sp.]RZJ71776.1 MAG: hypothetical protein EOO49_08920 [Flavobacterium sp.]